MESTDADAPADDYEGLDRIAAGPLIGR